MESDLGAGK